MLAILARVTTIGALRPLSEANREERCKAAAAIQSTLGTRCESVRALLARDTVRALTLLRQTIPAVEAGLSGRTHAELAQALLSYGDTVSARRELAAAVALSAREYVREDYIARVYFRLGDVERSIDWWRRAIASRSSQVIWLTRSAEAASLRTDARVQALLHDAGVK